MTRSCISALCFFLVMSNAWALRRARTRILEPKSSSKTLGKQELKRSSEVVGGSPLYGVNAAGHVTDPAVLSDCGGERTEPLKYEINYPVGMVHFNMFGNPDNYKMEMENLWMYPADGENTSVLFYKPGKVIEFNDHVDLARYLGFEYNCAENLFFLNGSHSSHSHRHHSHNSPVPLYNTWTLMKAARHLSQQFDTIKFSHHFDITGTCEGRRTCFPHDKNGKSQYQQEWVALHSWKPHECPGHPFLSLTNGTCTCTNPDPPVSGIC
eukprot:gnl/MRDRNA2_/MRDRNA2_84328_c0_seq2.p1 gnl/MRDRNA2_/MRDRNA2_84328_c0~~gnl/MRDRNA2_/MRDRNA2_84328_c0_seq2.p1  ORF type:complete len:267 (+),score=21.54 gnl/MRDRNA2_/MRDRNA2_84328_c0_seq2:117-917(+)